MKRTTHSQSKNKVMNTFIYKCIKQFYGKSILKTISDDDKQYINNIVTKLTEYIKKHPFSLYSESSNHLTPYMYASMFNIDTLNMLHNIYENVIDDIPDVYIEPFEYKNKNGQSLIHFVVERVIKGKQKLFMLDYIINNIGVDINVKDKHGNTALHLASIDNKIDIVKILLFYGADVNVINKNKKTPINYAVINKNMDLFKLLLYKGANYKYAKEEENYYLFSQLVDSYKKKLHKKMIGFYKKKSKNKNTQEFKNQHIKLCSPFINDINPKIIPEHYKKELQYLATQLNIDPVLYRPELSRDPKNEDKTDYDVYNNLCKLISHKILMKKSLKK